MEPVGQACAVQPLLLWFLTDLMINSMTAMASSLLSPQLNETFAKTRSYDSAMATFEAEEAVAAADRDARIAKVLSDAVTLGLMSQAECDEMIAVSLRAAVDIKVKDSKAEVRHLLSEQAHLCGTRHPLTPTLAAQLDIRTEAQTPESLLATWQPKARR